MQKKNVINLIRFYAQKNDSAFRQEAYQIAKDFDENGDSELSQYIRGLLSDNNTFVPQMDDSHLAFFRKVELNQEPLYLPDAVQKDVLGIINAAHHRSGVNKFLFQGDPGTGKTETVKQLARALNRQVYSVNFDSLIDSKLGQSSKNIVSMFDEIRSFPHPEQVIVLFDEFDAIAMNRIDENDLREMGRVTTTIIKELDDLNGDILLIAATNLYASLDKALVRRFDYVVNFNRYTQEDLLVVATKLLDGFLSGDKTAERNVALFKKIICLLKPIPYPGDLKNLIKTSLAFGDASDGNDYFRQLLHLACPSEKSGDIIWLKGQGFTVREIEVLTGISKSQVSRGTKK